MKTLDKVKSVIQSLSYDKKDKSYVYNYRYMCDEFENDEDFELIREKMTNLVNKLNELRGGDLKKFMLMDFEKEIWEKI